MDDEGLTRQELLLEVRGLRQKLADTRRAHQIQVEALLAARHRAEAAGRKLALDLETERARLRAVLDLAPEAIAVADAQGRIILSNPKADLLYARPVAAREGSVPGADPCRSLLAGAALEGESCRHAELSLWPEGEWGEVLAHAGPVRDRQGRITGAVAVFQDISRWREIAREHRRLQEESQSQAEELGVANEELQVQGEELQVQNEELREQTQILEAQKAELEAGRTLLKSVLEQMPASVVVAAAPNGPILLDNPLADRIWEAPLQSIDDLEGFWRIPRYHPDGRRLRREEMPLWRSLNLGEHVVDEELVLRSKHGGPIHLSVSSAPVRDAQGRVVAGVVTHFDITARKQTETALRTSKAHLYTVFENLNEGLVFASLDGRLFNWNQAAVAMHGFASLEECSRYLPEFAEIFELTTLNGAVLPFEQWPLARIFRGEQLRDLELRVRRLDTGWQRILNYSGALACDPNGQPLLAVVSVTDITDRKRAEEDLRASEARFRTMANAIPQLAWTANSDGYLTWYNQRWYDYTGTTPEEMEGWGWQKVHDPEVMPQVLERWRASIATGRPFDMVFPLRGADGQFRQFLTRVMPLKDADGQVIQWFGTNTDITERLQAEAALRRSEARFRSLVEANIIGFVVANRENLLEANDAFLRMVGYSREDLRAGLNWSEMTPPEYRHLDERALQEILTKGEYTPFEKELISKDGKRVSILTGGTLLKAEPLQVVGLVLDITTRKQAETALRESQRDLNRAQAVAHIGSWRLNVRRNELFWSDETCRIFGIAPGAPLTYESFLAAVHPNDQEHVVRKWEEAQRGEPYDLEHRIIVAGAVKWVREKAEMELDSQGELVAGFGTVQDITELKQAEAAQQRSNQRLDLLADTAGQLLASASPQQVVNSLCQKVMTFLDCDAFFNFLVDESEGRLHLNACAGIPTAEAQKIEWLDYGVAVCGCAAQEGCRIIAENIQTTPDPRTELVKSYGIHAYACHPLVVEGRLLGTLSFGTRTRSRFSADDLALMKAVADQVAIAMARKLAEEALRTSETRLRMAQQVARIGTFDWNIQTGVNMWTPELEAMYGLPPGSFARTQPAWEDLVHPDDRQEAIRRVEMAFQIDAPVEGEWRVVWPDGSIHWLTGRWQVFKDDSGKPLRMTGINFDITARKQAEAALRASESRERARAAQLQAILDATPGVILLAQDPQGWVITGNRGAYELLGLPPGSNISKTPRAGEPPGRFRIMKDGRELPVEELPVHQAAAGLTIRDLEIEVAFEDGTIRHLLGNAVPLSDENGRPRGAVAVFVDITTRKQAEDALLKAHEELEEMVKERTAALRLTNEHLRQEILVRRQAEEALGYERERLFAVLERIPAHVSLLRPDHTFAFVNGEFVRRFGDPGPKRCYEQMGRQDPCEECQAMAVFQKGEPVIWEWTAPDGKNYQIYDYPFIDVDGSPLALEMGVDITARKQAEEDLKTERERFFTVLERIPAYVALIAPNCTIPYANREFIKRFGDPENRLCYEFLFGLDTPCEDCKALNVCNTKVPAIWEWTGPDSNIYQIYDYPFIDVDGSPLTLEMGVDITMRKHSEEQVASIGRMYRMLSQVNEAIVRAPSRDELFRQICRIMMEEGDFLLAWVGLVDPENRIVKAAAHYDLEDDYSQNLVIPLADVPEGRGPTGIAAREGRPDICNDIAADPRMAPWREAALVKGFRSSAAFPLRVGSKVVGVLSVYAGKPEFFSRDEIALLESLAGNLSFALDFLDREARRRQADEALRESEERLRYLASQLLHAQERERHRLALELHDDLGQSLMVLKMQIRSIEKLLPPEQWQTREQCTEALSYMNGIVDNVRRLSRDLRPAVLEDLGLPAALRFLLEEMHKYYGLEPELDLDDLEGLLSRDEQVNIYRIFQESLTNIVKHAHASRVRISIKRKSGGVEVRVKDNGVGFDPASVLTRDMTHRGLGLAALEERVRMLGSKLTISSRKNRGTTLTFIVPAGEMSSKP